MADRCEQTESSGARAAEVIKNYVRAIENQCHPEEEVDLPVSPHSDFEVRRSPTSPGVFQIPKLTTTVSNAARFASDVAVFNQWQTICQEALKAGLSSTMDGNGVSVRADVNRISFVDGTAAWPADPSNSYLSITFAAQSVGLDPKPDLVRKQADSIRLAFAKVLTDWAGVPVDPQRIVVETEDVNWGEPYDVTVTVTPPACAK